MISVIFFFSCEFCLFVHAICFVGTVDTFTATVIAGDVSRNVSLAGSGLWEDSVRGSVRGVRFELASTCTSGSSSSNTVVTAAVSGYASNGVRSAMSVMLPDGGLSAGLWSVCVDWTASVSVPSYVRVGASSAYVEVGELLVHSFYVY